MYNYAYKRPKKPQQKPGYWGVRDCSRSWRRRYTDPWCRVGKAARENLRRIDEKINESDPLIPVDFWVRSPVRRLRPLKGGAKRRPILSRASPSWPPFRRRMSWPWRMLAMAACISTRGTSSALAPLGCRLWTCLSALEPSTSPRRPGGFCPTSRTTYRHSKRDFRAPFAIAPSGSWRLAALLRKALGDCSKCPQASVSVLISTRCSWG